MIAIDLNGTIKTFSNLPKVWTDENGTHLNIADGTSFGFYPVVTPAINQSEELGNIYFDANAEVFTYPVESRTYVQTLDQLKEQKIANLKHLYNSELAKTDWIIIRDQELGNTTDQTILDDRAQLRTDCSTHETSINAKTTKASVVDYELPSFI
jgi:hypothetical protein